MRGFSLPEVIVSIGILAGISIITMKLVEDQMGNEAFLKGSADISKTVSSIEMVLNNPESCRYTLKERPSPGVTPTGLTLPNNGSATISGFKTHVERISAEKILLLPNSNYGTFRTADFSINYTSDTSANVILNFIIRKKNLKLWRSVDDTSNDIRVVKRIPILIQRDGSSRITDCGPVISSANMTAKEKFCRSLGATAIWNNTPPGTCTYVPQTCPYGQVPERLTNLAVTGACVNIQEQIDLSFVFKQSFCINNGNGFTIIREDNSFKVQCL